jgi:SNF2 family DNA or RNA helicase
MINVPMLKHQIQGTTFLNNVEQFTNKPVGALFLSMGLGKSRLILEHVKAKAYARTIIVTKKSIVYTFAAEIDKWTDFKYQIVESGSKKIPLTAQIVLINYDMLDGRKEQLIKYGANAIVLDESHCIKTKAALRTEAAFNIRDGVIFERIGRRKVPKAIGRVIPARFILTGTSLTRGFEDWFTQFRFLDDSIMPNYITNFRAMYCPCGMFKTRGGQMYPKLLGYTNITESQHPGVPALMDRVRPYVFSVKKEDCLDLPEKTFTTEEVEMTPIQRKLYRDMREDSIVQLHNKDIIAQNYLTRIMKLQQIANGFVIRQETKDGKEVKMYERVPEENAKISWLRDWLPDIAKDYKVIIWTTFIETGKMVCQLLDEMGIKYAGLNADMAASERQLQIDRFQTDDTIRAFASSQVIGGYGTTLHAASYAVFFDHSNNYVDREQATDRIHRIGQVRNCHYINLVTAGTVEKRILKNLSEKKDLHNLSIDELSVILESED